MENSIRRVAAEQKPFKRKGFLNEIIDADVPLLNLKQTITAEAKRPLQRFWKNGGGGAHSDAAITHAASTVSSIDAETAPHPLTSTAPRRPALEVAYLALLSVSVVCAFVVCCLTLAPLKNISRVTAAVSLSGGIFSFV